MLEACIHRRTGDIIVVKPEGSPWSTAERDGPDFGVVKLDDPQTEAGSTGVRAYPYAVYAPEPDDPAGGELMVQRSRYKIDTAKVAPGGIVRREDLVENLADFKPIGNDGDG